MDPLLHRRRSHERRCRRLYEAWLTADISTLDTVIDVITLMSARGELSIDELRDLMLTAAGFPPGHLGLTA